MLRFYLSFVAFFLQRTMCYGYECSPRDCDYGIYECVCARSKPPGGLKPRNTPQFIIVTADGAITESSEAAIRTLTSPHRNPNGCNIPVTWFASINYTNATLARELFLDGHEIATRTLSMRPNPSVQDVVEARRSLSSETGIPEIAMNGFRSPNLLHDSNTRNILHHYGFRYDSSITEAYGQYNGQTSLSSDKRLWPYTMDNGIPQNCAMGSGTCSKNERWPGLWEIPVWLLQDDNDAPITAMDPYSYTDSVYTIYKREFERNYYGSRAPLGIFIHPSWLQHSDTNIGGLQAFLKDALQYDNVYVVTINQLLDWMIEPVTCNAFVNDFTSDVQCPSSGYIPKWTPDRKGKDSGKGANDGDVYSITANWAEQISRKPPSPLERIISSVTSVVLCMLAGALCYKTYRRDQRDLQTVLLVTEKARKDDDDDDAGVKSATFV